MKEMNTYLNLGRIYVKVIIEKQKLLFSIFFKVYSFLNCKIMTLILLTLL